MDMKRKYEMRIEKIGMEDSFFLLFTLAEGLCK